MRSNSEIIEFIVSSYKEKGWSLSEFSRRLKIPKSSLSRYFNYTRQFPINKAHIFAEALGLSTEELLGISQSTEQSKIVSINPLIDSITKETSKLSISDQKEILNIIKNKIEANEKTPKLYDVIATTKLSAGIGYAFNEYDQERVYVENRPPRHDVASFVHGDSMEPRYYSGDLVYLVDKGLSSYCGEVCAIAYDGETYIKRVFTEAGRLRLESLNPKYKDIYIDFPPADGEFIRIYEVVGSDVTVPI